MMNKPTFEHFYEASVIKQWFRWRGEYWYQAEISLYKVGGGHQKTEEDYSALIEPWSGFGHKNVFIDECLFTFDEVVAMRRYFLDIGNRWCDSFRATLFLDYPIDAHMVGPQSPSQFYGWPDPRQIHFYNAPGYSLEFKLMGSGKFRGITKEEEEIAKAIQAELEYDYRYRQPTEEELADEKAEMADNLARFDGNEVPFHGRRTKLMKDSTGSQGRPEI